MTVYVELGSKEEAAMTNDYNVADQLPPVSPDELARAGINQWIPETGPDQKDLLRSILFQEKIASLPGELSCTLNYFVYYQFPCGLNY